MDLSAFANQANLEHQARIKSLKVQRPVYKSANGLCVFMMICLVGARRERAANMLLPVRVSSYLHWASGFGGAGR